MPRVVSATCTACSTACTWVLHVLDNTHAHAKNTSRLVYRKKRWLPLCWIQAVGHCIILAAHAYANTHTPHTNMHKTHHQLACRSRSGVPLSHDEASCRIQAAVRGFIWRQRIKKESEHELIFVGMKPKVLCSIHILKRPFFWLSQPPLIHLHSLQASKQHNAAKSLDTLTQSAGIIKASKCSKIFGYTCTVCRHQGIKTQQNKTNTPKITQARAHLATGFASTRSILVCYQWRAAHSICAAKTAGLGTLCMWANSTRNILVCHQWRASRSICAAKTAGLDTLCMWAMSTRSILVCHQWRAARSACAVKTAGLGTLCM